MGMKQHLRAVKSGVQATFEGLWAMGFWLLGRRRRPVERWRSEGGKDVLVLAPHPDDEVCGCGGTAVLHLRGGDRVLVVYVTDGRRSTAYGLGPDEMARRRRREAEAAAAALGVQGQWWALPEGEWEAEELSPRLGELLRERAPRVIYAPCRVDFHPEHHKVAHALARALAESPTVTPTIRIYQLQVPLTPALTNLVADTSRVMAPSHRALQVYTTQLGVILPSLRLKRYTARYFGLAHQGEEFWQMTSADYQRLHLSRPEAGEAPPWGHGLRSFRHYAWSDPLAYVVGLMRRRRLARWLGTGGAGSLPL